MRPDFARDRISPRFRTFFFSRSAPVFFPGVGGAPRLAEWSRPQGLRGMLKATTALTQTVKHAAITLPPDFPGERRTNRRAVARPFQSEKRRNILSTINRGGLKEVRGKRGIPYQSGRAKRSYRGCEATALPWSFNIRPVESHSDNVVESFTSSPSITASRFFLPFPYQNVNLP